MSRHRMIPMIAALALTLSSCTTIGPTVEVRPGPGKSGVDFSQDRKECMARTDRQLQPVATAANLQASSTQDVAASNGRIQVSYDQSYGGCMSARGNVVSAAAAPPVPDPARPAVANASDTIDASNTPALSDADSRGAERFIGPKVRALLKSCPGEKITIAAHDAPLGPGVVARLVALNQPDGGDCLGHIGESDYLVLKTPVGGWRILLAGEPGSIGVLTNSQDGSHRDLELRSFGSCIYSYRWDSGAYQAAGAQDCTLPAPVAPYPSAEGRLVGR